MKFANQNGLAITENEHQQKLHKTVRKDLQIEIRIVKESKVQMV